MAAPENMEVETVVNEDEKMGDVVNEDEKVGDLSVEINWESQRVEEELQDKIDEKLTGGVGFTEVLNFLLQEEKTQRKADKRENTMYVIIKACELCINNQQWTLLKEQIASFARRHGQFKEAIQIMVQTCMNQYTDEIELDTKIEYIDALIAVAEGKMYLELERAKLTMKKCAILEFEKNDLAGAAEVVKDLQVETYGSIERRQKIIYILEQMRVFLACQDPFFFVRAKIRSNHIGQKSLAQFADLSLTFHKYVLEIHHQEEEYHAMAKSFLKVRDLGDNQKEKDGATTEAVMACVLAPYTEEQHKLLFTLYDDPTIKDISVCKKLLQQFTTYELIDWPLADDQLRTFAEGFQFSTQYGDSDDIVEKLRTRTVQHNIRVVARYYTEIQMSRLTEFLKVDTEQMERYLSEMVVAGDVHAKIDRVDQSIRFGKKAKAQEIVTEWGENLDQLVHLIENTCHEIQRENMVTEGNRKKKKGKKGKK